MSEVESVSQIEGSKVTIKSKHTGKEVDITEYISLLIDKKEQSNAIGEDYFRQNSELKLGQKHELIIRSIRVTYEKTTKEVKSISINGYLLEK